MDMNAIAEKVLAASEEDIEKMAEALDTGITAGELKALANFQQSKQAEEAKSAHNKQLFGSMRRIFITPALKAGGDQERRLRVTAWSQFRRTDQYKLLRAELQSETELLIAKFAIRGEEVVENTRVLVEQGVVELRGKDRKSTDEDDD